MTYMNYPLLLCFFLWISLRHKTWSNLYFVSFCIFSYCSRNFPQVPPPILRRNCYSCTFPTPLIYSFLYPHSISSIYTKNPHWLFISHIHSFLFFFAFLWGKPSLQRNETQSSNSTSETLLYQWLLLRTKCIMTE